MTAPDLRKETPVTISTDAPTVSTDSAPVLEGVDAPESVNTDTTTSDDTTGTDDSAGIDETAAPERSGDTRALLAVRVLASLALFVSAVVHAKLAVHAGFDGPLFARGHLFAMHAVLSALLALALLTRDDRVWLVAVVLSVAGLGAILASVYAPLPAVGPFPGINEPAWLVSKAVVAFSEITVIALWLIRQIAPPLPPT